MNDINKIIPTDINEFVEFDRHKYHYTKVGEKNNFYAFKVEWDNIKYNAYEIWKGKKHKLPDGSFIYSKPSDNDFGVYGWYIVGKGIPNSLQHIK